MTTQKRNTVFRATVVTALIAGGMASTAFAANVVVTSADPSTLVMFAIGLASLVATRKRVR